MLADIKKSLTSIEITIADCHKLLDDIDFSLDGAEESLKTANRKANKEVFAANKSLRGR